MKRNRDKEDEDGISFDYIYEQYRHSMFGIAYAILRDSHAAEDITSECLFKISETIDRIKYLPEREIQDYIATIVKNRSIDLYRRRQKHPEYSIDDRAVYAETGHAALDYFRIRTGYLALFFMYLRVSL